MSDFIDNDGDGINDSDQGTSYDASAQTFGIVYVNGIAIEESLTAEDCFNKAAASSDLNEKIAYYTRATQLNRNFLDAHNYLGMALASKGDLDGAIAEYDRVILLDSNYGDAYTNRGNARRAKGDLDGAISDYTRAIELKPNDAILDLSSGSSYGFPSIDPRPYYVRIYYNRGLARFSKFKYDEAISDYNRAIQINPSAREYEAFVWFGSVFGRADLIHNPLAEIYSSRALARYNKNDYDGTISDCDSAIALKPDLAEAYNHRGLARRAKGENDTAISDYNRAIELNPSYALAYNNRGYAYEQKGNTTQAIADYQKALQLDPNLQIAKSNLARFRFSG